MRRTVSGGGQSVWMKCPTWRSSLLILKTSTFEAYVLVVIFVVYIKKINGKSLNVFIRVCLCVCRLYQERLSQVKSKLSEVEAGRAAEYLEPLAVLLENMQVRTKVAGNWNTQTRIFLQALASLFTVCVFFCVCQASTGSCVWSLWRTNMSVRSRQHANTGRSRWHTNTQTYFNTLKYFSLCVHIQMYVYMFDLSFFLLCVCVCLCRVRSCCCLTQFRVNWRRK